jgi:uncharacterized membrane protein YqjE
MVRESNHSLPGARVGAALIVLPDASPAAARTRFVTPPEVPVYGLAPTTERQVWADSLLDNGARARFERDHGLQNSSEGKMEGTTRDQLSERSLSELVQQLSNQTSTLVRDEIRLAQLELQEKGKRAGIGAGLFGGSGLVALYGLGALIAAVIMLIATALEPWLAALIVSVGLFALAGILALTGKKQVEEATPPAPEQAIESAKQDIEVVKERAGRA